VSIDAWLENMAMCYALRKIHLQHEGPCGGISTEGERSSMMEDVPATIEHGSRSRVIGNV
jgi:hypothetical protein